MADVTREHRIAAVEVWSGGVRFDEVHCGADYARTGDTRGIVPIIPRIAQAIADAEAHICELAALKPKP